MPKLPSDLKLIDELLCVLKDSRRLTWVELEVESYAARQALTRLRRAWESNEMPLITLSLAKFFDAENLDA